MCAKDTSSPSRRDNETPERNRSSKQVCLPFRNGWHDLAAVAFEAERKRVFHGIESRQTMPTRTQSEQQESEPALVEYIKRRQL